jgi:hypothetical protein
VQKSDENGDLVIAEMTEVRNPAVSVLSLVIDELMFRFVGSQPRLNEIEVGAQRASDAIHDVTGFAALGVD